MYDLSTHPTPCYPPLDVFALARCDRRPVPLQAMWCVPMSRECIENNGEQGRETSPPPPARNTRVYSIHRPRHGMPAVGWLMAKSARELLMAQLAQPTMKNGRGAHTSGQLPVTPPVM